MEVELQHHQAKALAGRTVPAQEDQALLSHLLREALALQAHPPYCCWPRLLWQGRRFRNMLRWREAAPTDVGTF